MLRVAICDDDPAICRLLERMIAQVNRQQLMVEAVESHAPSCGRCS